jgi:hypothetical protein
VSLLLRRGLADAADSREADPLSDEHPGMAALVANSVRRKIAVGNNTGHGVVRVGDQLAVDGAGRFASPRCATVSGFSVHANVCIEARDRMRLERLCRYAARPAVAAERLTVLRDGRLLYALKCPWRDGTNAVVFERQDFLAKLAVLTPAPRAHLIRYHGVLGPAAVWRPRIIPIANQNIVAVNSNLHQSTRVPETPVIAAEPTSRAADRNYTWAQLMKRVFSVDVLQCECCDGRMKVIAAISQPDVAAKILRCLGLPSRAPPTAAVWTVTE